jgi:hypothetical protein
MYFKLAQTAHAEKQKATAKDGLIACAMSGATSRIRIYNLRINGRIHKPLLGRKSITSIKSVA